MDIEVMTAQNLPSLLAAKRHDPADSEKSRFMACALGGGSYGSLF
jgi:hypothetical protein